MKNYTVLDVDSLLKDYTTNHTPESGFKSAFNNAWAMFFIDTWVYPDRKNAFRFMCKCIDLSNLACDCGLISLAESENIDNTLERIYYGISE